MGDKIKILVKGLGASPGIVTGSVCIASDPSDALKRLQKGDILVVSFADPSWMVCMRKVKAIITNQGGILSHAAIVARELSVPCIVGTGNATEKLVDGSMVTVDGKKGIVYLPI